MVINCAISKEDCRQWAVKPENTTSWRKKDKTMNGILAETKKEFLQHESKLDY
jgi:hypothetical protein